MIDLYSFQRWPDIVKSFGRSGSYTPSWSAARKQSIAGDADWWNAISPAYRWMMGEMEHKGMPCPNPDAAPLWAWARWVDSKGRAHTRPDRRYPGFRNQYDGLELLHLRVDESRVLCTDFDQYHCVINNWPCAPLDAGAWPPAEYNRWLDEHWDDPPEKKRLQYRENVIVDPKRLPDRWIQACVWTITPADVVEIRAACGKNRIRWCPMDDLNTVRAKRGRARTARTPVHAVRLPVCGRPAPRRRHLARPRLGGRIPGAWNDSMIS